MGLFSEQSLPYHVHSQDAIMSWRGIARKARVILKLKVISNI